MNTHTSKPLDTLDIVKIEGLEGTITFDEHGATHFPLTVVNGQDESVWPEID